MVPDAPTFQVPPVDTAFAALNPPVDPVRAGVITPEALAPHSVAEMIDHRGATMNEAKATGMIESLNRDERRQSRHHFNDMPVFGVVTITNTDWRPSTAIAAPPSLTSGLGMALSAQFAIAYNQAELSRQKRRWAVVTNRGTVLMLCGILFQDRPLSPSDFPKCVLSGLTYDQAEALATEANEARVAMALVPRLWSVAVRRADTCGSEVNLQSSEGGAN